ncbi:hypothetical protein BAC1_01595 [uncultured bacterium]|nr:hypothetical protein BAC1_01595 [uncultured bacterium]
MALHSFSPGSIIEYVPEYGKNKENDPPCIVKLRYVPFVKTQEYARLLAARTRHYATPDKSGAIIASQEIQKRQFIENIDSVSGFFVGEREVSTPEELWDNAPAGLVYELVSAMEDSQKLRAGIKKEAQ